MRTNFMSINKNSLTKIPYKVMSPLSKRIKITVYIDARTIVSFARSIDSEGDAYVFEDVYFEAEHDFVDHSLSEFLIVLDLEDVIIERMCVPLHQSLILSKVSIKIRVQLVHHLLINREIVPIRSFHLQAKYHRIT